MGAGVGRLCMALDPVASETGSGAVINRHCLLEIGHDGLHQSRDVNGFTVHEWRWTDDHLTVGGS